MFAAKLKENYHLERPDELDQSQAEDGEVMPEPPLPPHVTAHLGNQLQAFYVHLLNEPIPERFVQLLEQLDQKGEGN